MSALEALHLLHIKSQECKKETRRGNARTGAVERGATLLAAVLHFPDLSRALSRKKLQKCRHSYFFHSIRVTVDTITKIGGI